MINTTDTKLENVEIIKTMPHFYKEVIKCLTHEKKNDTSDKSLINETIQSNLKVKRYISRNKMTSNILTVKDLFCKKVSLKSIYEVFGI